ncbi:MAG: DUF1588 domain-containing protein, partial [Planctomycetes bacterium]|nr:DUF1588 domain-containing protein [Planctomycetota bacterium]
MKNTLILVTLIPALMPSAVVADTKDEALVQSFFKDHCVRCHNARTKKGKFELHDLKGDIAGNNARFAAILERLRAGDMPPEKEPQPDLDTLKKVIDVIQAGIGKAAPGSTKTAEVPVRPADGNHLPHSLLFGGKPGPSVPPPARLWRLSPAGYSVGFLKSLNLGGGRLSQPFSLHNDPGIKDYSALYWIDEGGTDILMRNAESIAGMLLDRKPAQMPPEFKPLIDPKKAPSREQLETAIRSMYRMVLIREPSPEEIASLIALHKKCSEAPGDLLSASRTMLMAPLLSPEALHRFEVGRGAQVRPGVRMLSPEELAFAISLAYSNDREPGLFAAAKAGGLKTKEDVEKHIRRIYEDPNFYKPRLLGFFHEYFGYDRAPEVCKDDQPDYVHIADQLVLDTNRLVLNILEKDQNVLKELLTTPKSFVNGVQITKDGNRVGVGGKTSLTNVLSASVASKIGYSATDKPATGIRPKDKNKKVGVEAAYGLKEWPANQPVDLPGDRIGILMQPSWLVAWSSNFDNDPVRRGLWIRERLLGDKVPEVPVGVVIVLPDDPKRTLRDRMKITKDNACWKCHQKIDDLGFPFEAFDHFGRPRTTENSVDYKAFQETKKWIVHKLPLNTTGIVYASGDPKSDGPVKNAAEMIRKLADSERVRQVFIRYAFRYYMGRNETPGDAATLQEADR